MPRKKNASMKVKAPGAKKSVDNMKYEIANEFGINLGEITKRLVENGKNKKNSNSKNSK